VVGLVLTWITSARLKSERIGCENHLRQLGLFGVQHASPPGRGMPNHPLEELPPGTFQNPALPPDQRMSWYAYMLNVLVEGPPTPEPDVKHHRPAGLADLMPKLDPASPWDSAANAPLANYRLAVAICPAQVRDYAPNSPVPTNYIAVGGLGLDTPARSLEDAGSLAGAYRYNGPTPFSAIKDGLQQTAQIVETTADLGPWLRGGPSTLRGLDERAEPYVGPDRPFGGCHPGGVYVSMADGSVRFVKDTIMPPVFRAMFTIAGGPAESNFDGP
jgi:prepilin-type processing-associated H-X9-DG protein